MGKTSPNPLGYYMSGALQPVESPQQDPRMPGTWINSPKHKVLTPHSLSVYTPESPEAAHASPGGNDTDDAIVTNIKLTDPCIAHKSVDGKQNGTSSNTTVANKQPVSDTADPSNEEFRSEEVAQVSNVVTGSETNNAAGVPQRKVTDTVAEKAKVAELSPASSRCLNSLGEVDPLALEIQRCLDRSCKFNYNPRSFRPKRIRRACRSPETGRWFLSECSPAFKPAMLRRPIQALTPKAKLPSYQVDLLETPDSPVSPTAAWYQIEYSDTPQWSYKKGTPLYTPLTPRIRLSPHRVTKASSRKKRVAFYSSPRTGGPVSRFKKYVPGTRIDDSYPSSPSENNVSISDEGSFSIFDDSNASVDSSPTKQEEEMTGSPMQGVEATSTNGSSEPAKSPQETQHSPPVTPENSAGKRSKAPSPSDQLFTEGVSPVAFDPPPLNNAPAPVLKQITNGRIRHPQTATFIVTAEGSPMRIRSSSTSSSAGGSLLNGNTPIPPTKVGTYGSNASSPLKQGISIASVGQLEVSSEVSFAPSPAGAIAPPANSSSFPVENSNAISNEPLSIQEEQSGPWPQQSGPLVGASSPSSPSAEVIVQGDSSSATDTESGANGQSDIAAQSSSASSPSVEAQVLGDSSFNSAAVSFTNEPSGITQASSTTSSGAETTVLGDSSSMSQTESGVSSNGPSPLKEENAGLPPHDADVPLQSSSIRSTTAEVKDGDTSPPAEDNTSPSSSSSPQQQSNMQQSSQVVSVDSTIVDSTSVDPVTVDPFTADSVPVDHVVVDAIAVDPVPADPVVVDPGPVDPVTVDSVPVDPVVVDPVTPMTKSLFNLNVSDRKHYLRSTSKAESDDRRRARDEARAAKEKARKEKEAAEKKAKEAKEAQEEREKSGARRIPIGPVIEPLPAEWEAKVNQALTENPGKTVATSLVGVNITRRDIGKILPQPGTSDDPQGWLNDEVVTAYLQIIVEHALKASGHKRGETPRMHAFNTFFYKNLSEKGPQSIARWAKKAKIGEADLLKVERVFIPVNMNGVHWTLLVVSPKFRTIEYFDSFHGDAGKQVRHAKAWLKQELEGLWKEEEWKVVGKAGPKQRNGSDCGVFVSTTAKCVMLGVDPMAYGAGDIPCQRRRMVAELMNCGFDGEGLETTVVFPEEG